MNVLLSFVSDATFCIIRVFNSEYSSRFTQPTKFKYVDGVWIETPVNTGEIYNALVSIQGLFISSLLFSILVRSQINPNC